MCIRCQVASALPRDVLRGLRFTAPWVAGVYGRFLRNVTLDTQGTMAFQPFSLGGSCALCSAVAVIRVANISKYGTPVCL